MDKDVNPASLIHFMKLMQIATEYGVQVACLQLEVISMNKPLFHMCKSECGNVSLDKKNKKETIIGIDIFTRDHTIMCIS